MQNDYGCTRVVRDVLVFWDLVDLSTCFSKTSIVGESVSHSATGFAITPFKSESSCLAAGVIHEYSGRFSEDVVE